jgi:hypothetical protein
MTTIKKEMRERAWLLRGLVNSLKYDADYIYSDVENYDVVCMGESIKDAKETIQSLVDNVTELEYLLYLLKQNGSQ